MIEFQRMGLARFLLIQEEVSGSSCDWLLVMKASDRTNEEPFNSLQDATCLGLQFAFLRLDDRS
jgi:hypothetical protein